MTTEQPEKKNQSKSLAGVKRKPGTKDYALILSSLISNRNEMMRSTDPEETIRIYLKISEKLQELGFTKQGQQVKDLIKRKVNITYKLRDDALENLDAKKAKVNELVVTYWPIGNEKHLEAKSKKKK